MTPYKDRQCELTRRLAEDMMIRNLADSTIDAYTYHVRRFADFIEKPLERATVEDVRTFQLYLIQTKKVAYSTFNQAVCALRFFYRHTQPMPWPVTMVPFGKRPRTLPTVLRHSYATGLLEAGVDLLTISKLLGHASFVTTMIYLHCRREHLINAPSPLDWLPVRQLPTYKPPEENNSKENDPNTAKRPPTS